MCVASIRSQLILNEAQRDVQTFSWLWQHSIARDKLTRSTRIEQFYSILQRQSTHNWLCSVFYLFEMRKCNWYGKRFTFHFCFECFSPFRMFVILLQHNKNNSVISAFLLCSQYFFNLFFINVMASLGNLKMFLCKTATQSASNRSECNTRFFVLAEHFAPRL